MDYIMDGSSSWVTLWGKKKDLCSADKLYINFHFENQLKYVREW